ncbi:MAG: glycosyltransferase family 4 protein [Formivibrio sp.]|nr:glycosyltransferase family 4 protein [Formivibrio sp.]
MGAALVKLGCQVSLIVHGKSQNRDYIDERINVLQWPSPRPTRLADAKFLHRLLSRRNSSCVISNFGSTALMMTIGVLHRVPVRIHWHHTLSTQIQQELPKNNLVRIWFFRQRAKLVYRMATHNVANSQAARMDLAHAYGVPLRQCAVFWNCLEDPAIGLPMNSATLKQPERPQRLVCVGRFHPCKGQDILLRAVALLVQRLPKVTIEFVGDGPWKKTCERISGDLGISSHCVFCGELTHSEVLLKMTGAWATIVPSRTEAFGLVNIESMAMGTPVIGSATGGITEIIRDHMDGLLFRPEDHEALARCIVELAENPVLRNQLSLNSRQRFLENFELSRSIKAQADWVCGLIEAAERRG